MFGSSVERRRRILLLQRPSHWASYCDILNEHLLPYKGQFKRRHILHDAAPSHMAKKVKEWFTDQRLGVLVLPPHSPQFNAIEEVWAWLKHEVRTKHPMNEQQLKDACEQAWNSLSQEKISSYIAHASALIKNASSLGFSSRVQRV